MRSVGRTPLVVLALLAALLNQACSDDETPPLTGDLKIVNDGAGGDGIKKDGGGDGWLPDGVDPKCPLPGPCILTRTGEQKHANNRLVIGERLTLTGKQLSAVDAVYVGAASAPLISVSATQVVCKIGPRTPPGIQTLEIKFGTSRRMFGSVEVSRLALAAAADYSKLQTFDVATHSASMTLDLTEAPAGPPSLSASGRYAVARGATKLVVADLALEQAASVGGLTGETAASWVVDSKDGNLLIATASGKLLAADLSGFPSLTASAVAGAPKTVAVALAEPGLLAGVGATGEIWYAAEDLKTFTTVKAGSAAFTLGSGGALTHRSVEARDGALAAVALEGSAAQLGLLSVASGALKSPAELAASGALEAAVARGGSHVALSRESSSPELSHVAVASPTSLKTIALGGSGASRVVARALPDRQHEVVALVGPQPASGAAFVAAAAELLDLSKGQRITAGGKAALELADLRDAAGDPINPVLHVITGTHYRSYDLSVSGATVTVTEQHPSQLLDSGKDYRWALVQP